MKILIIINSLEIGGAEKQAVIDANLLISQNHNVSIAFYKDGHLSNLLDPKIEKIKLFTKNIFFVQFHILYLLLKFRFDIIHAHMFWAEKVSVLPAFLTGHKVIFNEHGLGLWRKWYHKFIMRLISSFAKQIVCSCELNKNIRFVNEHIPPRKLITIYNSVEKNTYRLSKVDNLEFIIGYVGRFHEVKRLHLLIEIAELCKLHNLDIKFLLVGEGKEENNIKSLINEKKLSELFDFIGYTLNVQRYYQKMSVFILPSRIEGFSMALLEAGSYGIPLIAFDVGGNSEICINEVTGYLIPDCDIVEAFMKIKFLYEHRDILENLSIRTKSYITDNFSHEKRLHHLINLYDNILKGNILYNN